MRPEAFRSSQMKKTAERAKKPTRTLAAITATISRARSGFMYADSQSTTVDGLSARARGVLPRFDEILALFSSLDGRYFMRAEESWQAFGVREKKGSRAMIKRQ